MTEKNANLKKYHLREHLFILDQRLCVHLETKLEVYT